MAKHLIFFDGDCVFCNRSIRHFISIDKQKRFLFAPLGGATAKSILIGEQKFLQNANSLILVENFQTETKRFWKESRAIFRIYWLVGKWGFIGLFSFFPGFIGDPLYRWFSANRNRFKITVLECQELKDRLLP